MSKQCDNNCGRFTDNLICHSCYLWLGFVRQAKRNIERYWEKCRRARGK